MSKAYFAMSADDLASFNQVSGKQMTKIKTKQQQQRKQQHKQKTTEFLYNAILILCTKEKGLYRC